MTSTGSLKRRLFLVTGLVQGVGFRPFVANLADHLSLCGTVANTGRGVEIDVQGAPEALDVFAGTLREKPPPMAFIAGITVTEAEPLPGITDFRILASRVDPFSSVVIPPDIATCAACASELADPADRRHRYPFTNCTDCGPRYSIIESIPYDRPRTSMAGFTMCPKCRAEYRDPRNRRFHAQPNACPVCGPTLTAHSPEGEPVDGDPLTLAVGVLQKGGTVALLGLGGFHLACDASSGAAVTLLRDRKNRPAKPLAVMCADVACAKALCELDGEALKLLESPSAPIVLCREKPDSPLAANVAPGQSHLGVFLPYTPLHRLLFSLGAPPFLVMTSGNRSDEPMIFDRVGALDKLSGVADLFLFHDRPVLHPVDDSVVKAMEGSGPVVIRRARGYAPRPLALPIQSPTLLALGAELMNTTTVLKDSMAFVGPHAGDLKNLDTEDAFRNGVKHLLHLLRATPEVVVCDLNPVYRSSVLAAEFQKTGLELIKVQHHEAHGAACMAEQGFLEGEGLVVALDGVGLGGDGTLWGGELLVGAPGRFRRVGHLLPVPQPGGDAAAREPWRMLASWLMKIAPAEWRDLSLDALTARTPEELNVVAAMAANGVNSPLTSSCGRLFDAAAALLGFSGRMLYSAQAPMELEALAASAPDERGTPYPLGTVSEAGGSLVLDPSPILAALLDEVLSGAPKARAARKFHRALADSWVEAAAFAAQAAGVRDVFLTGGCFQNSLLHSLLRRGLLKRGLAAHVHRDVPPNDGGISFGQAAHAAAMLRENTAK